MQLKGGQGGGVFTQLPFTNKQDIIDLFDTEEPLLNTWGEAHFLCAFPHVHTHAHVSCVVWKQPR